MWRCLFPTALRAERCGMGNRQARLGSAGWANSHPQMKARCSLATQLKNNHSPFLSPFLRKRRQVSLTNSVWKREGKTQRLSVHLFAWLQLVFILGIGVHALAYLFTKGLQAKQRKHIFIMLYLHANFNMSSF